MTGRVATYRVQLRPEWGFAAAAQLVDYLADLGVSHLYTSPIAESEPGSQHGYDVVDPTRVDAELGGDSGLRRLWERLGAFGMGQLLDLVPNHMSVDGPENPYWWDVLARGHESRFAEWFDIEWEAPGADGRVLLAVLGAPLEEVLGELRVERLGPGAGRAAGEQVVRYFEHVFPIAPGTLPDGVEVSDESTLRALLEAQHHQLRFWRDPDAPNYRRFFDIDGLAGVRVEEPDAFAATTALIAAWTSDPAATEVVEGARIDHIDGLAEPEQFLEALRRILGDDRWLLVEKILETGETLPATWPVDGTTGYEFADRVTGLFVDPTGGPALDVTLTEYTGDDRTWDEIVAESKEIVLERLLSPEVGRLERAFASALVARGEASGSVEDRTAVVRAVLAGFDVYRTYLRPGVAPPRTEDLELVGAALTRARSRGVDPRLLDLLGAALLEPETDEDRALIVRLQQTTSPVAAKAVEDTALYRYHRLVSRAGVGIDPSRLAWTIDEYHAATVASVGRPASLLGTSTHDSKRSEDVRARLCVLSQIPTAWAEAVHRWTGLTDRYRTGDAPDRGIQYLAFQTLVGAWQIDADRLATYLVKAAKEAKQRTSWRDPDAAYEDALERWVHRALADHDLVADLEAFVGPIVEAGRVTSLAMTALKLTAPGVPDLYQGTELWDLSLVDPDNRRPVDFGLRRQLLAEVREGLRAAEAWARADEGVPKLLLIHRLLELRHAHPEWFGAGAGYEPVRVVGRDAERVVAGVRAGQVVTVVPRLALGWSGSLDAGVELPAGVGWRDVLTGRGHAAGTVPAGDLLAGFPVAVLVCP